MRYQVKSKCEICGVELSPQGLVGHRKKHLEKQVKEQTRKPCPVCGKVYSLMGVGPHMWRAHGAGQSHKPTPPGSGHVAWNKGKTKKTDPRVAGNGRALSKGIRKKISEGTYNPPPVLTLEQRGAASRRMSRNNPGGRCKWYTVDGRRVQGTWERDIATKMCELGLPWSKAPGNGNLSWLYEDAQGKRRRYTPDFFLPDLGIQLEIKGYWWGEDKQKMAWVLEQNPESRIKIIEKDLFVELLACSDRTTFITTLNETPSGKGTGR